MIFLSGFESVIELLVEPDGTLGYKGDPIRTGPEHSLPLVCAPHLPDAMKVKSCDIIFDLVIKNDNYSILLTDHEQGPRKPAVVGEHRSSP